MKKLALFTCIFIEEEVEDLTIGVLPLILIQKFDFIMNFICVAMTSRTKEFGTGRKLPLEIILSLK